jgi:hypothetical protein
MRLRDNSRVPQYRETPWANVPMHRLVPGIVRSGRTTSLWTAWIGLAPCLVSDMLALLVVAVVVISQF